MIVRNGNLPWGGFAQFSAEIMATKHKKRHGNKTLITNKGLSLELFVTVTQNSTVYYLKISYHCELQRLADEVFLLYLQYNRYPVRSHRTVYYNSTNSMQTRFGFYELVGNQFTQFHSLS